MAMWQNENGGSASSVLGKKPPPSSQVAKLRLLTHKDIARKRRDSNSDPLETNSSSATPTQGSITRDTSIVDNVQKIIELVSQYPFDIGDTDEDDFKGTASAVQTDSKNRGGTSRLDYMVRSRLKQLEDMRAIAVVNVANPPVITKSCRLKTNFNLSKYSKRPIVNISNAKCDAGLLNECLSSLRWKGYDYGRVGDLHWVGGPLGIEEFTKFVESSEPMSYTSIVVNRYPNMHEITKKRQFSEWLRCCAKYKKCYSGADLESTDLNFYPPSFMLPRERCKVERLLQSGRSVILKPSAGSLGVGVKIIVDAGDFLKFSSCSNDYIAQEYIAEPALLDGKKFDIRLYMLMTNVCGGFRALLSRHAMVRVCTESYKYPSKPNVGNHFIHLTNYSINRFNNGKYYRHESDVFDVRNSKRPLSFVLDQLAAEGFDKFDIWRQMVYISESVASAIYPQVDVYRNLINKPVRCFQLLGLDVIIDVNGKVWLLEANANPSLQISYMDGNKLKRDAVDLHVKFPLVKYTLDLIHRYCMDGVEDDLDVGGMVESWESDNWQVLDVNVPPEIINYLHLYNHCKGARNREDLRVNSAGISKFEWLTFCSRNGLLTVANTLVACNGCLNYTNRGGKALLERLYDRICSLDGLESDKNPKCELNLLKFMKLMEMLACVVYSDSNEEIGGLGAHKGLKINYSELWGWSDCGADCMWETFVVESSRNLCDFLDAYIFPL